MGRAGEVHLWRCPDSGSDVRWEGGASEAGREGAQLRGQIAD